jgi:glycosyltransferase domain-containing protein
MRDNLIMIIPTYNRRKYLERAVKYYSSFPCKVYICDSSKEKADIEFPDNMVYRWVPQSNFFDKIYDAINETSAAFYALSPDDDYLKMSTLLECLKAMEKNEQYVAGIGKQLLYKEEFDGLFTYYKHMNRMANIMNEKFQNKEEYVRYVAENYQNVLWSLYRREVVWNAFHFLSSCSISNGNFPEVMLTIETLKAGQFYLSESGFNYREDANHYHWGAVEYHVSYDGLKKSDILRRDMGKFKEEYKNDKIANLFIKTYMDAQGKPSIALLSLLKKVIPSHIKDMAKTILRKHPAPETNELDFDDLEMARLIKNVM